MAKVRTQVRRGLMDTKAVGSAMGGVIGKLINPTHLPTNEDTSEHTNEHTNAHTNETTNVPTIVKPFLDKPAPAAAKNRNKSAHRATQGYATESTNDAAILYTVETTAEATTL